MLDAYSRDEKIELIENIKQQIREIFELRNITYGMAKTIIQGMEAELLEKGDTFLNQSKLKNVSPYKPH